MRHLFKQIAMLMSASTLLLTFTSFQRISHLDDCSCSKSSWGFFGHKKINEMAVYTLPEEMFGFYKTHLDFIIEHSVDPDRRRYGVKGEAECHYIDMDHYCFDSVGCNPFNNTPLRWTEAVERYSEDSLRAHGIVPWHVYLTYKKLTKAFQEQDLTRILRFSAEIGHYIGDSHVPLHTTSNYNGQKTGQRGIHGFWESRLPELYEPNYDFFIGQAEYIKAPQAFIWERVKESFHALDSVLIYEAELTAKYPTDQKYAFETRNNVEIKTYSEGFSEEYNRMLTGQVERRMRRAVASVGSFWYTAWVDGGQPDLSKFIQKPVKPEDEELINKETNSPNDPKLKVRDHE
jgi:hypothetical protein